MNILKIIYLVLYWYTMTCWPIILIMVVFIRPGNNRIGRRMQRGVYWRWNVRTFGTLLRWADFPVYLMVMFCQLGLVIATGGQAGNILAYTFFTITLFVDWVTGSEDPPWKKLAREANKLLDRIKPVPPPVIDLGGAR